MKRPTLSERSLCVELHNLLRVIWSGKYALVTPFALLSLVKFLIPKFRSYQQQDAQEFLCYLRDFIHNEVRIMSIVDEALSCFCFLSCCCLYCVFWF